MVHPITCAILCLAVGNGATHDLTLFGASETKLHPETELIADAGDQGIQRAHRYARTPKKATKNFPLTHYRDKTTEPYRSDVFLLST